MVADGGTDSVGVVAAALLDKPLHHRTVVRIRRSNDSPRQRAGFVSEPE